MSAGDVVFDKKNDEEKESAYWRLFGCMCDQMVFAYCGAES